MNKILYIKINMNKILTIIYFLRYLSIVKFSEYKVRDNINFGSKIANNFFFIKSIKNSNSYFEYGSGNSTMFAKKLKKKIFYQLKLIRAFIVFMKKKISKILYIVILVLLSITHINLPNIFNKRKPLLKL